MDDRKTSSAGDPDVIEQLLIEQLCDQLNPEGHWSKRCRRWSESYGPSDLKFAFESPSRRDQRRRRTAEGSVRSRREGPKEKP